MSPEKAAQDQVDTWSSLKTVTTFDLGSTQPVGTLDSDLIVQKIKPVSATSLLVESLISQLCKFLEKDPTLQKKIYDEICHKLHHMNLIDKTYGVEEFEFMRNHYQKALFHLLSVARTTTDYNSVQKIVPAFPGLNLDVTPHSQKHSPWDWSRYHTEFDELEFIDKGGFGRVFKARNKLDGEEYAVKKIYLRYHNVNRFLHSLREVKMLAKLNHQNIVSYKAAWLEPLDYVSLSGKRKRNQEKKNIRAVVIQPSSIDDDSSGIVFKNSDADNSDDADLDKENISSSILNTVNNIKSSNGIAQENMKKVLVHHMQKKHICKEDDDVPNGKTSSCFDSDTSEINTSANSTASKVLCKFSCAVKHKWEDNEIIVPVSEHEWATLYIQMQLCDQTLRKWLNEKNAQGNFFMNPVECLRVFQQIVQGVNYIHSKGIVHHDIKPSNIFVNTDLTQVQVGDFGLACCLQHSTDDFVTLMSHNCSHSSDHKGQIGTKLYAAPEQLQGKCNPKSDIYSLGIVLFELLQPFSTEMERYKVINQLKVGQMPPDLVARVPKLAHLISEVMDSCPKNRPSAQNILEKIDVLIEELSQDSDRAAILSKDELIEQLLEIIYKQGKEIEELKTKVKCLEIEAKKVTG